MLEYFINKVAGLKVNEKTAEQRRSAVFIINFEAGNFIKKETGTGIFL